MNYKEKYKEALERARKICDSEFEPNDKSILCSIIFPELNESEDERICREIIAALRSREEKTPTEWLDWLEKQKGKGDIPIVQSIETKQPKYIDADEVFKWIMTNLPHYGNAMLAGKFKEDFEL